VRTWTLLAGPVLCWLALCATAAYGDWSAPGTVASSRVWQYSRPLAVLGLSGDGALVWHREERLNETLSGIEASTLNGGRWSTAGVLASSRQGGVVFPALASGVRGRAATVVWQNTGAIQTASRSAGGPFGRAMTLPGRVQGASNPQVAVGGGGAVGDGGTATIVYTRPEHGLWIFTRPTGGRWRPVRSIPAISRSSIAEVQVARDRRGETILAWLSGRHGNMLRVQTVVLGSNNRPERPPQTLLSGRRRDLGELRLQANASGAAVLAWHEKLRDGSVSIEASTRRGGGRFSRPVTVSGRRDTSELSVAIDGGEHAAVAYTRALSTQPGTPEESSDGYPAYTQTAIVEVATRAVGHGWSRPSEIAPRQPDSSTFEPQLAGSATGQGIMAIWTSARFRSSDTATYTGRIEAAATTPTGMWQTPSIVSPVDSFAPTLALSAHGTAIAAWVTATSSGQAIQTSEQPPTSHR